MIPREAGLSKLHLLRQRHATSLSLFHTSSKQPSPTPTPLKPSTADSGFVLSSKPLNNPFTSDPSFQRVLSWYLPTQSLEAVKPRLTKFGDEAISDHVKDWVSDAERHPPYVKQYNVWGQRNDPDKLVTSWGWKEAGKWGIANGYVHCAIYPALISSLTPWTCSVVAYGYEDEFGCYRRIVQHAQCAKSTLPHGPTN